MGACCSVKHSGSKHQENFHTFVYRSQVTKVASIPGTFEELISEIKSFLKISEFEVFIEDKLISDNSSYNEYLEKNRALRIKIKDPRTKGADLVSDSSLCKNIPENLEKFLCKVKTEKSEIRSLLVSQGFVHIHQKLLQKIPRNLFCSIQESKKPDQKLRYLNTFQEIHYFILNEPRPASGIPENLLANDDDLTLRVEGNLVQFVVQADNENILSSKQRVFHESTEGEFLFTADKFKGILSKISDVSNAEIIQSRELLRNSQEIIFRPDHFAFPESIEELGPLQQYMGVIKDKNGKFVLPWVAFDRQFVVVPKELLESGDESLSLHLQSQVVSLKRFKLDEKKDFFESNHFFVFRTEETLEVVLDEDLISGPSKKAKVFYGHEAVLNLKRTENKEKFKVSKNLDHQFFGMPVFSRYKFSGLVLKVLGFEVSVISLDIIREKLEIVKMSKKMLGLQDSPDISVKIRKNYPVISPSSISFKNSPLYQKKFAIPEKSEDQEIFLSMNHKPAYQEAENEENIEGEFQLEITEPSQTFYNLTPENFSYSFEQNRLIKYCPCLYRPKVIEKHLSIKEGGSMTSTPHGLVFVVGDFSMLILEEEDQHLPSLNSLHFFHSSVWHQDSLFVISGENTSETEFFDFSRNTWNTCDSLPSPRKNFSVCSSGEFIYLMGGEQEGEVLKSILRFKENWEELSQSLPMPLRNFGLLYDHGRFVVFGGKGKVSLSDKFFILDQEIELKTTGEFRALGEFNQKSIGYYNGIFSIVISQNEMIEYRDGLFKRVLSEW